LESLEIRAVPATIAWDGGPTGQGTNWLDPVNWVGDALPGTTDDAVIDTAGTGQPATVILTGSATVQNVSVAVGANLTIAIETGLAKLTSNNLTNSGTVVLGRDGWAGSVLLYVTDIANSAGGEIDSIAGSGGSRSISASLGPPSNSFVINQGTIRSIGVNTVLYGKFENSGLISAESGGWLINRSLNLACGNSGTLSASGGNISVIRFDPSFGGNESFTNDGTIIVGAGNSFNIGTRFQNYDTTTGSLSGGTYNIAGSFQFGRTGEPVYVVSSLNADVTLDGPSASINGTTGFRPSSQEPSPLTKRTSSLFQR
jgi:hypothetical protein